ncbi:MAG: archaellin/type IV pilin N-terminal domain-containing protein [Nanoarchaeota archaeon]
MTKKGLSPLIATILLIAMVIVIGTLIFLWFKGMQKEALTKFDGKNIERVCEDVNFNVDYVSGTLSIINKGNIPIQDFEIKEVSSDGSYSTKKISDFYNEDEGEEWTGLGVGGSDEKEISFTGSDKLIISPILIGETDQEEKKEYSCDVDKFGKTLNI